MAVWRETAPLITRRKTSKAAPPSPRHEQGVPQGEPDLDAAPLHGAFPAGGRMAQPMPRTVWRSFSPALVDLLPQAAEVAVHVVGASRVLIVPDPVLQLLPGQDGARVAHEIF